jgi:hypothetical protein
MMRYGELLIINGAKYKVTSTYTIILLITKYKIHINRIIDVGEFFI